MSPQSPKPPDHASIPPFRPQPLPGYQIYAAEGRISKPVPEKKKGVLFLKKKKQKDFYQWPPGSRSQPDCDVGKTTWRRWKKVFLLLFLQKKKNPSFPK
jgi:hypothetical protein